MLTRARMYGYYGATVVRRRARRLDLGRPARTRRQRLYDLRHDALVLHCPYPQRVAPNPFRREWASACRRFFADGSLRGAFSDCAELTILTYNNRPEPGLLERCLDHLGLHRYVVLGREVERFEWFHKVSLLDDHLRSGAVETEFVMCLDGDDVLLLGDPATVLDRFRATSAELLFCGTRGNQPPCPECWAFENRTGSDPRHRHLNAGAYIGRREYLAERLAEIVAAHASRADWCHTPSGFDDQLAWRRLHIAHHPRLRVDADCRIFLRFDEDR